MLTAVTILALILSVLLVLCLLLYGGLAQRVSGLEAALLVGMTAPDLRAYEDDDLVGRRVESWRGHYSRVLILSTVCESCRRLAEDISANVEALNEVDVLLSTHSLEAARDFIETVGLTPAEPRHITIDVGGAMIAETFGVTSSPLFITLTPDRKTVRTAHVVFSAKGLSLAAEQELHSEASLHPNHLGA
jgi:hypothetical protein